MNDCYRYPPRMKELHGLVNDSYEEGQQSVILEIMVARHKLLGRPGTPRGLCYNCDAGLQVFEELKPGQRGTGRKRLNRRTGKRSRYRNTHRIYCHDCGFEMFIAVVNRKPPKPRKR